MKETAVEGSPHESSREASVAECSRGSKSASVLSELVSYAVLVPHEEALGRAPFDVPGWMLYLAEIDALLEASGKKALLAQGRVLVGERAVALLPGSYKLWRCHLSFLSAALSTDMDYEVSSSSRRLRHRAAVSAYERSLARMNKMPRIWLDYIAFAVQQRHSVTSLRRLFDRALLALPATQHALVWDEYLCFVLGYPPPGVLAPHIERGPVVRLHLAGRLAQQSPNTTQTQTHNGTQPPYVPPETTLRVLRRYTHHFDPAARELLAQTALNFQRYRECALLLLDLLNDVDFTSPLGTTRHDLWVQFVNVCTLHPDEVAGVDFQGILRAVLKPPSSSTDSVNTLHVFDLSLDDDNDNHNDDTSEKATPQNKQRSQLYAQLGEMEGTLWTKLADYHIRSGEFALARSIYEEAMETVSRVRDFSLIFDSYMKFEEGLIEAMMEIMNDDSDNPEDQTNTPDDQNNDYMEDMDILLGDAFNSSHSQEGGENTKSADVELTLARAENLMSRRPLLLNRVLLRQNPHNVAEWIKRSDLYLQLQKPALAIAALEEAVRTVNSRQAIQGSPCTLYIRLAKIYEEHESDVDKARSIYERVCTHLEYRFHDVDDLAQCYAEWVELELRTQHPDDALGVARRSVSTPGAAHSNKITRGLTRSLRLWNLLLDLEESLGTLQTTKDSYNRALELKVATPSHLLNFASYLTDHDYYEESFTVYERGIMDLFPFPHHAHAKLIWKSYLDSFLKRYAGTKLQRARELFDRCLEHCPPKDSSEFFLLYGKFEEQYGLTKRALSVYERMCTTLPSPTEKYIAYQLYITKTLQYLGLSATRPLYERAIAALEDDFASQICLEYAKMEVSLSEMDRARTVLTYGAQMADPRRNPDYWKVFQEFELSYGNEETFREMLRVKRGVQAAYSTVNYNAAEMGAGVPKVENLTNEQALEMIAEREGVKVNEKDRIGGFVKGKRTAEIRDLEEVERRAAKLRRATSGISSEDGPAAARLNYGEEEGDEIDIDHIEEEEDKEEETITTDQRQQEQDQLGGVNVDSIVSSVRDVSTKAVPAAVFGGLTTSPQVR